MPNRIIKESIHTSDKVNRMSDFEFRLWVSLITYVDDYGRGDARPAIIKGTCFPLRERLTNRDIEAGLSKLADIGCISLYTVGGKSYLCLPNWGSHQNVRNKKSKFPAPPSEDERAIACVFANNCEQLHTDDSKCPRNPNPNPNPNPKENASRSCAEPPSAASVPDDAAPQPVERPKYEIPLVDGTMWPVTEAMLAVWRERYPAVDVDQAIRTMIGWCDTNRAKRKTRRGVSRFVEGWLRRDQDRGGSRGRGTGAGRSHFLHQFSPEELAEYRRQMDAIGGENRDEGGDKTDFDFLRSGVAPVLPGAGCRPDQGES